MNHWEGFTLASVRPSMSEAVDLLNQIEDQGYDPRFMFLTQQGVQVYGRKKESGRLPTSSESELNALIDKIGDHRDIEGYGGSDFPQ